ncbi:MAG: NYN domain-containing protein [Dehalococcoidales bacterium]
MKKTLVNFAFIDGTNIYKAKEDLGWKMDTKKFRRYLEEVYEVKKVYYCIGFIDSNTGLYERLKSEGYEMVFKETYKVKGKVKGNIDAELVLKSMIQYRVYNQTIIVTSDGDFACLVKYLIEKHKLRSMIASKKVKCSHLLEKASGTYICYLDDLKNKIELKY